MKKIILVYIIYWTAAISLNAEVSPTNQWVSFWSDSTYLDGSPVEPGDTIDVYDPQGIHCGRGTVKSLGTYPLLSVYRDNPYTPYVDEGAEPGDSLSFKINSLKAVPEGPGTPYWTFHGDVQKLNLVSIQYKLTITKTDTIDQNGGTVKDDSTNIEINIPAGAVNDTTEINIGIIENPSALSDTVKSLSLYYYLGPHGLQFADSITISIPYTQADLDSAGVTDPMNLSIYYYSTTNEKWIKLKVVNADTEYVYVKVKEFCYLVFGKLIQTGIEERRLEATLPIEFSLMQNYPNPFNPETVIRYEVSRLAYVRLEIFDTKGRNLKTLVNKPQKPGVYEVVWRGTDHDNQYVPSGVYILRMRAGTFAKMIKMSLCK